MTVVNPKSISGITSITTASGSDNLLTIHTSDANNTERLRIDSTGTTKIVTGIVTTLTATGSAKVGSGVTLSPDGDIFATGVTTSTTVQVGSATTIHTTGIDLGNGNLTGHNLHSTGITTSSSVIVGGGVTISESGIEASGIGITVANINGGAVSGRRNMIINGDQRIAQRGTTAKLATTTASYKCVDRFKTDIDGSGGGDFFHAQTGTGTTISADVPTGQGFSHSSKITVNTSASQPTSESNHSQIYTILEKQDVTHLEWGTSAAKTCTLSFWVKSSITGTYPLWFGIYTGTTQYYWTNYTINSANTWEKKVITVTGPTSGGAVDGTIASGLRIEWTLGVGSDAETGTLREWTTSSTFRTASGSVYLNENAGATWYMTGAQFEVGSQATAFEHRSFGDELALCQRYFYVMDLGQWDNIIFYPMFRMSSGTGSPYNSVYFPSEMRTTPSFSEEGAPFSASGYADDIILYKATKSCATLNGLGTAVAASGIVFVRAGSSSGDTYRFLFDAEL